MRIRSIYLILVLLAVAGSGLATPVTISFNSSLLLAQRGQTITFSATVTNTTASPVFLNGDAVNIAAPLTADDSLFFLNFPISLTANQMVTASIFSVMVPLNTPYGFYAGNFDILGGSTPSELTTIGSAVFAVNVVPEPGALGLLIAGALGIAIALKRKG